MDRKSPYIRNPKDPGGSKYLCAQDEEDFEQEKQIEAWLAREGRSGELEFQHFNRKGNARNTLVRAQVRLDAQISEDETGTFADLIAGSDGRDLELRTDLGRVAELADAVIALVKDDSAREEVRRIYFNWMMEQI